MSHRASNVVFWLLILLAAGCAGVAVLDAVNAADELSERIVTVTGHRDGDTFTIDGAVIRLYGADAPESDQPHGREATEWLRKKIPVGTEVRLRFVSKSYDREVCRVWVGKTDISMALIEEGFAWADPVYATRDMAHAERRADSRGRGLWSDESPTPPWHWRKFHGKDATK